MLRALSSAALALPGLAQPLAAESAPAQIQSDYRYSRYAEHALASSKVAAGGERDRYEIDIHQFRFATPLGSRFDLGLDLSHEAMSGATPWYVTPGESGADPVQVMTEATIEERRTDALLSSRLYLDRSQAQIAAGFSVENDYLAINGRLGGERSYNEKNTTLSGGVGLSFDEVRPSGRSEYPNRPSNEDKQSYDVDLGLSQVLGRSTTAQSSLRYRHSRGFLSDPYKLAFVASAPETDERPDTRNQFAWLTRLRQHVRPVHGALHFDYQYAIDDWEIQSHTFELAWYQQLFERIRLVPSLRYYSQSQAYFYAPFYTAARSDGLRSSDYRLSPFGALGYALRAEAHFEAFRLLWEAKLGYERYTSSGDLALGRVSVENPGLVSYDLFSVALTARF